MTGYEILLPRFVNFRTKKRNQLITLSTDRALKIKFSEITLEEFWIFVQGEYLGLSTKTLKILLQFSTSYLDIKTKNRARLTNLIEELRAAISNIRPNIAENTLNDYSLQ